METLLGRVKKVRYSQTGFAVVEISIRDGNPVIAAGRLDQVREGEEVELKGEWQRHPKFGDQFKVSAAASRLPSDAVGVIGFLDRLAHLGPKRAEVIVNHFGVDKVFDVIENTPERLAAEISGLTQDRVDALVSTYKEYREARDQIVELKKFGLTDWEVGRVREKFGKDAASTVKNAPYDLLEIDGFGWKTVDPIALRVGADPNGGPRISAAIRHVLTEARGRGNCFLPGVELARALSEFGIRGEIIRTTAIGMRDHDPPLIRIERIPGEQDTAVYLPRLLGVEIEVAEFVKGRHFAGSTAMPSSPMSESFLKLNEEQRTAVAFACDENVPFCVVTGGPGTGKTTLVHEIVNVYKRVNPNGIILCSPTGKAAKRLSEATNWPAATIHRTLGYNPEMGWTHDEDNPLRTELVVVDEASMVDVELAAALFSAIGSGTRVVLVGDVDQLPSVGPGAVLRDVIASGRVPVVRLEKIYRFDEHSWLAENAARVRKGQEVVLDPQASDFFFVEKDDPVAAREAVKRLVSETIPQRHGVHPVRDIQVLSPMHKGEIGVAKLNEELQPLLNPKGPKAPEAVLRGVPIRIGDKVRHTKNNYRIFVFNGEVGVVKEIDIDRERKAWKLVVDFGDRDVEYDQVSAGELVLNYAGTIHASQGSEYPVVVVVCHSYNSFMLSRNLLYTALTRAAKAVYVVGDLGGLRRACRNVDATKRYTLLAERIRG